MQSRFLAEFTLSSFASLRAVRERRANGLGMTHEEPARNPFALSKANVLRMTIPSFPASGSHEPTVFQPTEAAL